MDLQIKNRRHSFLLIVLGLCVFSQPAIAAKNKLTLSTGATYTTGDYGTSHDTDIYYLPLNAKFKSGQWTYKLTVPYLRKTGQVNVLREIGQVGITTVTTKRKTERGLGDVIASIKHPVYYQPSLRLFVDITGSIKFGTADNDKGLGTGENDYSVKLGFYHLRGDLTPYATLGYKNYGDSSSIKLNDVFFGSTGFSYKLSEKLDAGINFSFKEKVSASSVSSRVLTLFATQKLGEQYKVQAYVLGGFGDSSPDQGAGFSISYGF
jgi:hypothetical protein